MDAMCFENVPCQKEEPASCGCQLDNAEEFSEEEALLVLICDLCWTNLVT